MELKELFSYGGSGLLALLVLVQISPLKLDPFGCIIRFIGRELNKDIMDAVNGINKKVDKLERDIEGVKDNIEEQAIIDCRTQILTFGDEVYHGVRHSEERFNQMLDNIHKYDNYCASHPSFVNDKTKMTKKRILAEYDRCRSENDFL